MKKRDRNRNGLGMQTTFKDLLWWRAKAFLKSAHEPSHFRHLKNAQNVSFYMANSPFVNSVYTLNLKYHTVIAWVLREY